MSPPSPAALLGLGPTVVVAAVTPAVVTDAALGSPTGAAVSEAVNMISVALSLLCAAV